MATNYNTIFLKKSSVSARMNVFCMSGRFGGLGKMGKIKIPTEVSCIKWTRMRRHPLSRLRRQLPFFEGEPFG